MAGPDTTDQPDRSTAIRRQLSLILASPAFSRSQRSSQLLSYCVEQALRQESPSLNEYTIATEVFGRAESFDPRIDSLVRVEATRLRQRLQVYYESASPDDLIEIKLVPGSYLPLFHQRTAGPSVPPRRGFPPWWVAAAAAIAIVFTLAVFRGIGKPHQGKPERFHVLRRLDIPGEVLLFPALSPHAAQVFFASNRGGGEFRIWKQNWNGEAAQVLTPPGSKSYAVDVSPDGKWIAYWSSRHGGSIYQQSSSGGEELLVAAGGRSPAFSPDSRQILYWSADSNSGFGKAFTSSVTPGVHDREPRAIASDFDDAHDPQWTPDGRILLCGTLETNVPEMEHDLWVVGASGGTSPVKTGILHFLQARKIELHPAVLPTRFHFYKGSLVFAGMHQGRSGVYLLPLTAEWRPAGEPVLLHDASLAAVAPHVREGFISFSVIERNLDIWSIPLSPDGRSSGPVKRLTAGAREKFFPCLSQDGSRLHYVAWGPPDFEIRRKDLPTGVESAIYQSADARMMRCTADGAKLYFRTLIGGFPSRQAILQLTAADGKVVTVCEDCGTPTSVSPRGEFVAFETGSRVARIGVVETKSRIKREILQHPHHATLSARLSPDNSWIAFELDRQPDGKRILIAPFRGLQVIPEKEWIPITAEGTSSFEPAWGPAGDRLYFLSERAGSRDLWMQRLDSRTKKPVGGAQQIHPFRNPQLSPLSNSQYATRYIGLNVAPGQALLTLSELAGSIELMRGDP